MVSIKVYSPSSAIPAVIDMSLLSNDDLKLYYESSEIIEKSREKRKMLKKFMKPKCVQKTREEIFEISEVDENEYMKIATSACNDIDVNIKNLSADIEKIFQSFNDDINIHEYSAISDEYPVKIDDTPSVQTKLRSKLTTEKPPVPSPRKITKFTSTPNSGNNLEFEQNRIVNLVKIPLKIDKIDSHESTSKEQFNVCSVKDRISFFNKLSSGREEKKPVNPRTMKMVLRSPAVLFTKNRMEDSVKKPLANAAEDLQHLQPNFVRNRIKIFQRDERLEKKADKIEPFVTQAKTSKLAIRHAKTVVPQPQNNSTLQTSTAVRPKIDVPAETLVSKIRRYFDREPKTPPKFPEKLTASKKKMACRIQIAASEYSKKQVLRETQTTNSILASSKRTTTSTSSSSLTWKKTTTNFVQSESVPEKPTHSQYDPFLESAKSLKKLGDIVHTIRNIREQGMSEVSRELFQIFKQNLETASAKLAQSKENQMPGNNSRGFSRKRVTAVEPNLNSISTYPRVLKAIRKSSQGVDAPMNEGLKSAELVGKMCRELGEFNEAELTYESFVTSLQQCKIGNN